MDIKKKKIDKENYVRKGIFDFMMNFNCTRFTITTEIDVTPLYKYCKKYKHFNAHMIYAIAKACNNVENFHYFTNEAGTIYRYDYIHPANIFMTSENQIRFGMIDINLPIEEFIQEYERVKNEIYTTGKRVEGNNDGNYIALSCVKWFKFSSVSESSLNKYESEPEMTWDKIEIKRGKATVNMAITLNHALADGYDVHLFLEALQNEIKKFK